jgi:YHS domain-containing protein
VSALGRLTGDGLARKYTGKHGWRILKNKQFKLFSCHKDINSESNFQINYRGCSEEEEKEYWFCNAFAQQHWNFKIVVFFILNK